MNGLPPSADRPAVAVIGAGVSGLTVAFELIERAERLPGGIELFCLEAGGRTGGNIHTVRRTGFTCEWGPNGFLDNSPPTLTLIRRLGLQDRTIKAAEASARRFVFRAGRLREVPTDPRAFLGSQVLPWPAKLRLLVEPLIPRRRSDDDETVFDFAARRIGPTAASVLVDAMVTGIYAGDSRGLSLPATFPKMREMETEHGSLFRAMLARRKKTADVEGESGGPAGPGGTLTSFRDGMQELTDRLASRIEGRLWLDAAAAAVHDMGRRGFRLHGYHGAPADVAAVVLACPAWHAAELISDLDPQMAKAMRGIPSAPVAVVHLGYREDAIGGPPDGFGFLVPRGQGARILGTLWSSTIFEGRAPDGSALLTSMVGGAHEPDAAELDDEKLIAIVRADLKKTMDIHADPYFSEVFRHRHGIPQYTLGHLERRQVIEEAQRRHRGLFACGNSYRGVSVNACVEEASEVAEAVLTHLASLD